MRILALLIAGSLAFPIGASAQSAGLIITNARYDNVATERSGKRIAGGAGALERAGMQVITADEADTQDMREALSQFGQLAANADTLFVGLSGQFMHTATETYYLPSDGQTGPVATLGDNALPLSTVFAWLAAKPGKAVLMLTTANAQGTYGPFVKAGIGELNIPQGVTVVIGHPRASTDLITNYLSQPGRPFVGAAIQSQKLQVRGYAPSTLVFLDRAAPAPQPTTDNRLSDIRAWRAAKDADTTAAYQRYLDSQPNGQFAVMAEARIRALTDTPEARAERTEQSLDLSREARRSIQRNLSLLGFNTRGIDGIFGPGTRRAIGDWQRQERFDQTGYVTREQVALLGEQAERRSAELEAEAERRRQEQLVQDLDYWDRTGANGDERGLRAYLERYPDGEYAEIANERLAVIEDRKRTRADRRDRQLWDQVTEVNSAEAYRVYLQEYPNGAFRAEAEARLAALERTNENAQANAQHARGEAAMNLSPRTKQVVESRLKALGLRPGRIDGVFDDDTRRAIRRYQSARNMQETGYLSEAVVVQLMADSVRQIFR